MYVIKIFNLIILKKMISNNIKKTAIFLGNLLVKVCRILPDKQYLQIVYRFQMGKKLNLKCPVSFSEKLQWLKLYDRKPIYTQMVDKYGAKEYVAKIIGDEYIIPTLGVWSKPEEIEWDKLPNQFVLKCTHDSGGLVICKDKSLLDKEAAMRKLNKSLHTNYYKVGREWPYKNVERRIIAEEFMEDKRYHELRDYKFFCFNGVVKALFIATERQSKSGETKFDFFDENFNHLNILNGHPMATQAPAKPETFEKMKALAAKLSEGIPHVRVDLYDVNGKIYFGELTFSHWGGLKRFDPEEWDVKFGEWLSLPPKNL